VDWPAGLKITSRAEAFLDEFALLPAGGDAAFEHEIGITGRA
jgi:hypothetical protein